jgi:hypothetical protein
MAFTRPVDAGFLSANHQRKIRDRLFADDRSLRLFRLPDDPRQVSTGQDCHETGCHTPSKRTLHQQAIIQPGR